MNVISLKSFALLLFAVVALQALLSVEAIDFKKLFDKKNNNNKQSEVDKKGANEQQAKPDQAKPHKISSDDKNLDKELEKLTETGQRQRPRVDLAKIRAATAEADRIAAANRKSNGAAQGGDDDEPESYNDDHDEPHQPSSSAAGRRRRPFSGVARFIPGHEDQSGGVSPDAYVDDDNDEPEKAPKDGPRRFISTKTNTNTDDKSLLKPTIRTRRPVGNVKIPFQASLPEPKKSKFNMSYLTGKMNKGLQTGFKQVAKGIAEIPGLVNQATDSLSAMLQLDNKGRLLALIEEVKGDIHFVRKEFSKFSITWAPIMEKSLNYLGDHNLDRVKLNTKDELDFSSDALHSLVFGYEFMRLMMAWRENLLVAHEAYKLYLETVKDELVESKSTSNSVNVDENFIFHMKTIHAYMLLTAWLSLDELILEPRMKLDHLMEVEDDRPKNYESEYFRNIIVLQELYEPTIKEFDEEEKQVTDAIGHAGALTEDFEDVDRFFDDFKTKLIEEDIKSIDWEAPKELEEFMKKLQPQLQFNPLVYSRSFKNEIKQALQNAMNDSE